MALLLECKQHNTTINTIRKTANDKLMSTLRQLIKQYSCESNHVQCTGFIYTFSQSPFEIKILFSLRYLIITSLLYFLYVHLCVDQWSCWNARFGTSGVKGLVRGWVVERVDVAASSIVVVVGYANPNTDQGNACTTLVCIYPPSMF